MQEREGSKPEGFERVLLDPVVFQIFFDVRYPDRRSGQVCLTAHTASLLVSDLRVFGAIFRDD